MKMLVILTDRLSLIPIIHILLSTSASGEGWQQAQQAQPPQQVTPYEYFKNPPLAPYWHAYAQPTNIQQPKQQAQLTKGLATYFQDKNGQMDINKMMSTVGQMASTVQQVSPIVKSLGSFLKILR